MNNMFILFSEHGVIIKGFDHESGLSPYANESFKLVDGIYDLVPKELLNLLNDKSIEKEVATFCIWKTPEDLVWKNA